MQKRWDIFCHVVDNYGDAGVCWRLARQLADEFDLSVRLWIDDLGALKKIRPEIELMQAQQICAGVAVCHWMQPLPQSIVAADVVIEAFACELPAEYRAAMQGQNSLWINLEYLSAEEWVSGCHGLPSPQSPSVHMQPVTSKKDEALKKYFFFPGFRSDTGGVLGERDLPQRRRAFQADESHRTIFLQRFIPSLPVDALCVSLFAYRYAPIETLLQTWSAQARPIVCFVPEGQPLPAVSSFCGKELAVGEVHEFGSLTLVVLPFLTQDDYDLLLWSCDINFVRGEDSFVRAQWAAQPFIWQIYAQDEGAHWAKLDAFMALYGEEISELSPKTVLALRDFWCAWNGDGRIETTWAAYIEALAELNTAAKKWAERLQSGTNLAAALAQFCANQV